MEKDAAHFAEKFVKRLRAVGVSVADIMNMEHWSSRQELLEKLEICLREADEPTLRLYLRLLRTLQL